MSLSICKFVAGLIVELVAWCERNNVCFTISAATLSHFNTNVVHPAIYQHFAMHKFYNNHMLCPALYFYTHSIKMKVYAPYLKVIVWPGFNSQWDK